MLDGGPVRWLLMLHEFCVKSYNSTAALNLQFRRQCRTLTRHVLCGVWEDEASGTSKVVLETVSSLLPFGMVTDTDTGKRSYIIWEQYLGLEHLDTTPKMLFTSNQLLFTAAVSLDVFDSSSVLTVMV
ncbi:hypothetical protein L1887_09834 [Cichorium endivia]|nr:hypothetical protein L1887_09834 [Cichorium endivia]